MALIYLLRSEPYPAMAMPAFAGSPDRGGVVEKTVYSVEVEFAGGRTQHVEISRLLPPSRLSTSHILRAFEDEDVLNDSETIDWLKTRAAALFPKDRLVGMDIIWQKAIFDIDSVEKTPIKSGPANMTHLQFDGNT